MQTSSRSRILDYLKRHQTASVRELAGVMQLTGANIRHHLEILIANGQVEIVGLRHEERGRPVNLFGLSEWLLGDNLAVLSDAILENVFSEILPDQREEILGILARRLGGSQPECETLHLTSRLVEAVELLNSMHYHARWEAGPKGPRLILGHCPYSAIIAEHPELCQMDKSILEFRLGHSVRQIVKLQRSVKGLPYCEFIIGEP